MTIPRGPLAAAPALALALAGRVAIAQTTFPEVEPNGTKPEATPAVCMLWGDLLTGTTTGTSVTAGNLALTSADTFKVKTCLAPLGVYRNSLTIALTQSYYVTTLQGLDQTGTVGVGGVAGTADTSLQQSNTFTSRTWYGFGKGEQVYYRVLGSAATTNAYTVTLSSLRVTPFVIGPFAAGTITISTLGQGHATDTDLWVYDSGMNPIATFGNDDVLPAGGTQSKLTRVFPGGTYYIALTLRNLANNQVAASDDNSVTGALTDFPDIALSSSSQTFIDCSFAVTDAAGTLPIMAEREQAYEIVWFRFNALPPVPGVTFCEPGIAGVIPCACSNAPSGPGRGCNNSSATGGAILTDSGVAMLSNDTVLLSGSAMLPTVPAIYLQGQADNGAGVVFGDGVRCADVNLKRLGLKFNTGGASSYGFPADQPVSQRSAALGDTIPPGSTRFYQTYYRDPIVFGCLVGPGGATYNISCGRRMLWLP